MNTVKDVRDWLQKLAKAQIEGVWSVRPMVRIGREDLLRAIEVLEPFDTVPDAPKEGREKVFSYAKDLLWATCSALAGATAGRLLEKRRRFGVAKYGQELMTHDGRDTFKDIQDEQADAIYYVAKGFAEREMTIKQREMVELLAAAQLTMVKAIRRQLQQEDRP